MKHEPIYTYEKEPAKQFGLQFTPVSVNVPADVDFEYNYAFYQPPVEVAACELAKMDNETLKFKDIPESHILEIGVHRNGNGSFTNVLIKNKHARSKYVGVDLEDKKYLEEPWTNICTLQTDSANQEVVREYLKANGIKSISILAIDGWHSLNMVLNDWLYVDLLIPGGKVFMHDTNMHPGPQILVDAIDPTLFNVEKCFEDDPSCFGLTVVTKL